MKIRKLILFALILVFTSLIGCGGGGGGGGSSGSADSSYTITYNGNTNTGGVIPIDGSKYQQGQTVTVLGNTGSLVKTGYTFAGWNTLANGTGTTYASGQTFTMGTANVTLYAIWTTNTTYTVTYNGNTNTGGSAPTDSNQYQQGQTVTVLGNTGSLVKTGYTFAGWNTLANGTGTTYASGQTFTMGTANVTLYAKWTTNVTYTVTYNGNTSTSGSAPLDNNQYQQGQTVTVAANTGNLVKTGYTFAGWNTLANGTGTTYASGQTFTMGAANVTLYAKWTINPTYTVTLNPINENGIIINSLNAATANTVYRDSGFSIGCNWVYSSLTGIQDFVCAGGLLKFNISTLSGKIIDNASLQLTASYVGVGYFPRQWHTRAMYTTWSTTTITWNIIETSQYYLASEILLNAPSYSDQVFNIDVKSIVSNWNSGTWNNYGFVFGSHDYTFPYAVSYDAFGFYGRLDVGGSGPKLIVTYH